MNLKDGSGKQGALMGRSLSQDLTFSLVLVVLVVSILATLLSYLYLSDKSKVLFEQKSIEYIDYLSDSLALPLWRLDDDVVVRVCSSFARNEAVALLRVTDNNGAVVFEKKDTEEDDLLLKNMQIIYKNLDVGLIEIGLTPRIYIEKNNELLIVTIFIMLVVIIVLVLGTRIILQRLLSKPLDYLMERTRRIAAGEYDEETSGAKHSEIAAILGEFNNMAEEVEKREQSLVKINQQLETEIVERERLHKELERKNKELEQVVYVTSHDLRTPLVNIEGFSKELGRSVNELFSAFQKGSFPEDIKEKVDSIVENEVPESQKYISTSITKMESLLSGLLKLSRLGSAELEIENIDMNELISDVLSILKVHTNCSGVKMEISELLPCMGDERQINQVFSNIIENAIKYLDSKRAGIIRISGYKDNRQSVYCVEDNGIGIAPEYQGKIFDIFYRLEPARNEGEGLGLNIVHRTVERHNGKIWVESEPGRGSKFYISLPGV